MDDPFSLSDAGDAPLASGLRSPSASPVYAYIIAHPMREALNQTVLVLEPGDNPRTHPEGVG
jgi:hypothetical protein